MSIWKKFGFSILTLLIIALFSAAMVILSVRSASFHLERANLAHKSYEAHLRLSADSLRLFNKFEALSYNPDRIEDSNYIDKVNELIDSVSSDLSLIRKIISDEILLVGDEEIEELEELAELQKLLFSAINDYRRVTQGGADGYNGNRYKNFVSELQTSLYSEVEEEVTEALDEEIREVEETLVEAEQTLGKLNLSAWFFMVIAIGSALLSVIVIYRNFYLPLKAVIAGAERFADGDYAHTINSSAGGEFAKVAIALNTGSTFALDRQKSLEGRNRELQRAVDEQTKDLRLTILKLEEQRRQRQQLLADVSHELRTPLTVIQGEADIALRGADKSSDVYKDALRRVSEAAKHTAQLVSDMLFISRKEVGKEKLQLEKTDICELVESTTAALKTALQKHDASVSIQRHTQKTSVSVDAKRIKQVFMILLENACMYGGRNIAIDLMDATDGLCITVKDDGFGIILEDQDRIFDRFFRGSNAAKRYEEGAGLGLPVAKSIIESHGGKISVESDAGKGTLFKIFLPTRTKLKAVS